MCNCSIQLLIDPADLQAIQATNRNIVVARSANNGQAPHVVWQSFAPGEDNTVAWAEDYAIYAANTPLKHGARILPTRAMPYPASPSGAYAFTADAQFHGPYASDRPLGSRQFCVHNEVPPSHYPALTFGVAQSAIINDVTSNIRPLSAQSIAAYEAAVFSPLNTVHVWLQAELFSGTVQTYLPEAVTSVNLGWLSHKQTLKYDATRDMFIPYSAVKRSFILSMPNVIWPGSVGDRQNRASRHAA
ncbi:MAG: hypothetical protein JOZ51_24120 [Chloroflexi bacterium]|nr:hypothetical protein [Chloroflexota bacterium]